MFLRHATVALSLLAAPAFAETPPVTYQVEGTFEDVVFAVEDAIVSAGLVVDHVSHTGEMLERTRQKL